jgi:hypothetical protein
MEVLMKKYILCGALGLALAVSGVFADHPNGLGIGVLGRFGWTNAGDGESFGGPALSLKIPSLPVFWGVNLDIRNHYFGLGVTGDYYIIDQTLANIGGSVPFGWYLGLGGYLGFGTWSSDSGYWDGSRSHKASYTELGFGARLPIGISLQIPISTIFLEAFLEAGPGLGLWVHMYDDSPYWRNSDKVGLGFSFPAAIGVRIWI